MPASGKAKKATNLKPDRSFTNRNKRSLSKEQTKTPPEVDQKVSIRTLSLEIQQKILDIFKNTFSARLDDPDKVYNVIQEVKHFLYNRDFAKAFGSQDFLEAYALRWSPSRALAYLDLFCTVPEVASPLRSHFQGDVLLNTSGPSQDVSAGEDDDKERTTNSNIRSRNRIICIGGGAGAEIVALAGFLRASEALDPSPSTNLTSDPPNHQTPVPAPPLEVLAIDIANWSLPFKSLTSSIHNPPPLSSYASTAAKAANSPLLSTSSLSTTFQQTDILSQTQDQLHQICENGILITFLFTLNELYTTSIPDTTRLLLNLTECVHSGMVLMVVDSPGSYSTVGLNQTQPPREGKELGGKKYPMHWFLEHTLLEAGGGKRWEKVYVEEGRWFRLDRGLRYPIALEDMRMWVGVYRRV